MVRSFITLSVCAFVASVTLRAQYEVSKWTPVREISDRHDAVAAMAVTADGTMYVSLFSRELGSRDTFAVFTRSVSEPGWKLIHEVNTPKRFWGVYHNFSVYGNTAFLAASDGLTAFRDGKILFQGYQCVPYQGFHYVNGVSENEVYYGSILKIEDDSSHNVVARHDVDTCETVSSQPISFARGSAVGVGRNSLGTTLIHYTSGRPENDTVFYRLDGTGVASDFRTMDRGFYSVCFTGYEDGWIVVGGWTRTGKGSGAMRLNASLQVVDTVSFPYYKQPNTTMFLKAVNYENSILFLRNHAVIVLDKATFKNTRIMIDDWERQAEEQEYGFFVVDAATHKNKLYVATYRGVRELVDVTSSTTDERLDLPVSEAIVATSANASVLLRGCLESDLVMCDVLGKTHNLRAEMTEHGALVSVEDLSPGLNFVITAQGSRYVIHYQP